MKSKVVAASVVLVFLASVAAMPLAAQQAGLRVWSSDIHDPEDGEQGGGPPSITMVGAGNGSFAGKVVVGGGAIEGLKAAMSDLRQGDAVIPASQTAVRYGIPWDQSIGAFRRPKGSDVLLESPKADFAGKTPVWVTVRVPRDARPGAYTGHLAVEAKGLGPVNVPVKLELQDWTLPDTQDYRTWIEMVQSPDTLAVEYGIPLWSEKHWEMIARSLQIIAQTGSRVVYVPLICGTNYGNEESMVRWVKKGSAYDYDFSIMDKYLDLAEKHMGKPKMVVFYVWETFLLPPKEGAEVPVIKEGDSEYDRQHKLAVIEREKHRDRGPVVTVVDSETGNLETINLPRYEDPASKAVWQPLWTELRKRMQKRGLENSMMIGMLSDLWAPKEVVAALNEVTSGLPWTSCSHHARWLFGGKPQVHGAPIGYSAVALDYQYTINPAKGRMYGWKKPLLHGMYWRFQFFNTSSYITIRHEAECNITGNQRGISRLGADFWPCIKNKRGGRVGFVTDRYPQSFWHSLNIGGYMLAPGPDGPLGTTRLEVFREGVQECEARILIEDALTDEARRTRLGADLAKRAQELLDDRQVGLWKARGAPEADLELGPLTEYRTIFRMLEKWDRPAGYRWFIASNWQERSGRLFAMAGEVDRKLAGK